MNLKFHKKNLLIGCTFYNTIIFLRLISYFLGTFGRCEFWCWFREYLLCFFSRVCHFFAHLNHRLRNILYYLTAPFTCLVFFALRRVWLRRPASFRGRHLVEPRAGNRNRLAFYIHVHGTRACMFAPLLPFLWCSFCRNARCCTPAKRCAARYDMNSEFMARSRQAPSTKCNFIRIYRVLYLASTKWNII